MSQKMLARSPLISAGKSNIAAAIAVGLAAFSTGPRAMASPVTWTALDGTDNTLWSALGNWDVAAPVNGDDLIFPTGIPNKAMNNDISGLTVNSLSFTSGLYTLTGNMLTMGGATPLISSNPAGSGAAIVFNNQLSLSATTQVDVTGTYRVEMAASVIGTGGITKTGSGTLRVYGTAKTYSGATTINDGLLDVTAAGDILPYGPGVGNVTVNSPGVLQANNQGFQINGLSGNGTVTKTGSNTRTVTLGNGNASGNFTGTFNDASGRLSVNKNGGGTQILGGTTAGPRGVTVNAGTLLVNGSISSNTAAASNNDWTIAAAGTIGGTGALSVVDILGITGKMAPGASTGVLDVTAGRTKFFANSTFEIELGGASPGDGTGFYDQLNLLQASPTDPALLDSGVNLTVSLVNSFVPGGSDVFYVLTRADANAFGTLFAGYGEGAPIALGSGTGFITYQANWTGNQATSTLTGGNDVAIYVPEPAALAAAGLIGLMSLARRRKSN